MPLPQPSSVKTKGELEALVEQARQASDLLKALAHESRLLILCLLAEGEKSVTELEQLLTLPQPTVSQQLARLRFDRLVNARRDGRTIYYSLIDDEVSVVIGTLYDLFCRKVRQEYTHAAL